MKSIGSAGCKLAAADWLEVLEVLIFIKKGVMLSGTLFWYLDQKRETYFPVFRR